MEGAALDPRDFETVATVFAVVLDGSLPPSGVRTHHHFPFMSAIAGRARTGKLQRGSVRAAPDV